MPVDWKSVFGFASQIPIVKRAITLASGTVENSDSARRNAFTSLFSAMPVKEGPVRAPKGARDAR